jgi:hypothetical protein
MPMPMPGRARPVAREFGSATELAKTSATTTLQYLRQILMYLQVKGSMATYNIKRRCEGGGFLRDEGAGRPGGTRDEGLFHGLASALTRHVGC